MEWIEQNLRELVISGTILVLLLAARYFLVHSFLKREELPADVRRRLIVNVRNATLLLLVLAMILIWARELQTMALSVFAIAVALVVATKELLLCVSGAFIRAHIFAVGDRIEVAGQRGDVIDKTTLTTKLMEIGPGHEGHQYTGRILVVPNSKLLSDPVVNETAMGNYLTHMIIVPIKREDNWREARKILLAAGKAACAPYQEAAARYFKQVETTSGHFTPNVEPRVSISLPDTAIVNLQLRVPIPRGRKHRIQQQVLNQFLEEYDAWLKKSKAESDAVQAEKEAASSMRNASVTPQP